MTAFFQFLDGEVLSAYHDFFVLCLFDISMQCHLISISDFVDDKTVQKG